MRGRRRLAARVGVEELQGLASRRFASSGESRLLRLIAASLLLPQAGPAILVLRIKGEKGAWNGRLEGARRAFNRCEVRVETGRRL
jgi:hypothetical protein